MISYEGKIIVVAGPTASGKSDIGLSLAKDLNGYIINADSRQIYKDLNIATAKPTPETVTNDGTWIINGIEHYLYDFVSPKEDFTLFDYQKRVQEVLEKKKDSNQIPILVGGTGLYIDSIVFNYDLKENSTQEDLSNLSLKQLQELAKNYLLDMTESDRNNRYRLVRAIQRKGVNREKGEPLNHIYFVIDIENPKLKEKIENRINQMFKDGLEKENQLLLSKGYTYSDRALRSIGYQEFEEYFNGEKTVEEVKNDILKHTLQYAKRQRTWFRRNKNAVWESQYQRILGLASNFISTE